MLEQDPEVVFPNLTYQNEALKIHKEAHRFANFWRDLFGWAKNANKAMNVWIKSVNEGKARDQFMKHSL